MSTAGAPVTQIERVSRRIDGGELRGVEVTPQGGIRVKAHVTRVGILEYPRADGTISREFRPPEEVFSPASLATLANAAVTDLHPPEQVIDSKNWRTHSIGHVEPGSAPEGDHVASRLVIQDAAAVDLIKAGERRDVSCGYTCEVDPTPGEYQGQPYDAVHRKIVYNHVGIGPAGWGRAGPDIALRLNGGRVAKIRIDGIEFEAGSDGHLQAQAKLDGERLAKIDALTKERDVANASLETERAVHKQYIADEPKRRARRDSLLAALRDAHAIKCVRVDEAKAAALDDTAVLAEIIALMGLEVSLEGKSPDAIAAVFEVLKPQIAAALKAKTENTVEEPAPVDAGGGTGGLDAATTAIAAGLTQEEWSRRRASQRAATAWQTKRPTAQEGN